MSNYLTTATAISIFQPISSMSNYLTIASATATYQPIILMSNYLTISSAIFTYQTKTDMVNYVNTSGLQTINGLKTFGTLPECYGTPQLDNQLVNKFYVDHISIH